MINYKKSLNKAKGYFPSHTDFRKRTDKSIGGAVLHAMSKESDNIQDTIEEYKKDFFLLCYTGREETIPAYFFVTPVGIADKITVDGYIITTDVEVFYSDFSTYILYQDGFLIIHPSALEDGADSISYIVNDIYTYKSKLEYRHIWNVFDEFALFAGLKRLEDETNTELAWRTLQVFKSWPSSTNQGLKNSIKNILINYEKISDDDISIEVPTAENLAEELPSGEDVYEHITQYNRDLFRTKKWDSSLWEHSFKKLGYLAHPWDKQPKEVKNGIGFGNDVKVDYLRNFNGEDTTRAIITGYKKDRKTVYDYVRNNNIETTIPLKLTKYEDTITPKRVEFRVTASEVQKINAQKIFIDAFQKQTGTISYPISDLYVSSENVTQEPRNKVLANRTYRLRFMAKSAYDDMSIFKCSLQQGSQSKDLRKESGRFKFKKGVLTNSDILAHVNSTIGMKSFDNIVNVNNGFSIESTAKPAVAKIDVTGMSQAIIQYETECQEVNVTDNSSIVTASENFKLSNDGRSYTASTTDSLSTIQISLKSCGSYSFELAKNTGNVPQGAIIVTTIIDGNATQETYTNAATISNKFKETKDVQILIKKYGQAPVTIKNISACRYKVTLTTDKGDLVVTPMSKRLPVFSGSNLLTVTIEAYTAFSPVVKFVHVGSSLLNAKHDIEFTPTADGFLDIKSSCKVALYDISSGVKLLSDNYVTTPLYRNTSTSVGYIVLDTGSFTSIVSSSPVIQHTYKGQPFDYIELQPGEAIDNIIISGTKLSSVSSKTLSSLLYKDAANYEVYISRATSSFIVKNGGNTELKPLKREDIDGRADVVKISGEIESLTAMFIIDSEKDITSVGSELDRNFETLTLIPHDKQDFVAYNSIYMLSEEKRGFPLANTFYPIMSFTELYFYRISDINAENENTSVKFIQDNGNEQNWSVGVPAKGLVAKTKVDFNNTQTYEINISYLRDRYILSNEIPLSDYYSIDGNQKELAEFIISPPEGMAITSIPIEVEETIYAENDGFNKLQYSNVKILSIKNSSGLLITSYDILPTEGILIWKDAALAGKSLKINYIVQKPVSIAYVDDNLLYKEVSYSTGAYKKIGPVITINDLEDGATIPVSFDEEPDKVTVSLSNDTFESIVSPDLKSVKIIKIADTDKLAYHNGYFYDSGQEFWQFCNKYEDTTDRMANVNLENVTRLGDQFLFRMKSTNLLPHSSMNADTLTLLCELDFQKKRFENISKLNSLTACNTLSSWHGFNMDISLCSAVNDIGINFKEKSNDVVSYAVFEITDYISKNDIISMWTSGQLNIYFTQETQKDNMSFTKSVCIDEDALKAFSKTQDFVYYIMKEPPSPETRYYIVIVGNGAIDDIIIKKYTNLADMMSSHTKNINKLGFVFHEQLVPNYTHKLVFDKVGSSYKNLEINSSNVIRPSTTVEWGLTQIERFEIDDCTFIGGDQHKDWVIATRNDTVVTTPSFYISNQASAQKVFIKVNDVFSKQLKGFTIKAYGCSFRNGKYTKFFEAQDTNIAEISGDNIPNFIKVEICMTKGQVVNSVDVYAKYVERDNVTNVASMPKNGGEILSKIYDLGDVYKFKISGVNFESNQAQNIKIYVRGFRENKYDFVATDWIEYINGSESGIAPVSFDDYRLLQFKIIVTGQDTQITIKDFDVEVIN